MNETAERLNAEQRRRKVADLYLKGWSQEAIAALLNVLQSTVSRDLNAFQAEWKRAATWDVEQARARELQKIDLIEREAWAAWQRSQTALSSFVRTEADGKKSESRRASIKNSHGDPRFLDLVNKCVTLTGKGANRLIIDKPIKNDEEARSPLQREHLWQWWQSTVRSRLRHRALTLLVQRGRASRSSHPHPDLPPSRGKEFVSSVAFCDSETCRKSPLSLSDRAGPTLFASVPRAARFWQPKVSERVVVATSPQRNGRKQTSETRRPHPDPLPEGEGTIEGASSWRLAINGVCCRVEECNVLWTLRK